MTPTGRCCTEPTRGCVVCGREWGPTEAEAKVYQLGWAAGWAAKDKDVADELARLRAIETAAAALTQEMTLGPCLDTARKAQTLATLWLALGPRP